MGGVRPLTEFYEAPPPKVRERHTCRVIPFKYVHSSLVRIERSFTFSNGCHDDVITKEKRERASSVGAALCGLTAKKSIVQHKYPA